MSHETITKQTVPTNGATENISIPLDKCFQLDASVKSIVIGSDSAIVFMVYNPTTQASGVDLDFGIPIVASSPKSFSVYSNTQVGGPEYLVCLSTGSDSLDYDVTLYEHGDD